MNGGGAVLLIACLFALAPVVLLAFLIVDGIQEGCKLSANNEAKS